ncbi:TPA: hypothetical protein N0F65_003402 [Lagenidium giganteum]|uniref:Choline transporter-like protein n=1 Tax=Lagenidium giganteum TaxID=4803 RepID=A0AAV2YXV2_9STRA|nr:TPA: hypothetical protein N0F65_003402 [Lagenidium giganteum]
MGDVGDDNEHVGEVDMEDLSLSPAAGEEEPQGASASLMPLSLTDSAGGSRPLPSLQTPITFRDVPGVVGYAVHVLILLLVTSSIRSDGEETLAKLANATILGGDIASGSGSEGDELVRNVTDGGTLLPGDISVSLTSLSVVNLLFSVSWLLVFIFNAKMRFLQLSCAFSTVGLFVLALTLFSLSNGDALFLALLVTGTLVADVLWMLRSRNGFDFVAVLFELVVDFFVKHASLAYVTTGTIVAYTLWACWVSTTIGYVVLGNSPWELSMLYVYFHFYWTSNIFKNILTVVVSGATMIWYYKDDSSALSPQLADENISDHDSPTDIHERDQPTSLFSLGTTPMDRRVVGHFVRCALTTSFGSICIGSLLCPVAHILWNILRWARRDESVFAKRFAMLQSDRVENFIRTYHKFTFVHIAGYGKAFYVAARDSWELIEIRGVEAIVDDDLTSRLLLLGANGWASIMCALTTSALLASRHGAFFAITSFVLCYTTMSMATQMIGAVIKTLFVCFAESPTRLSQLHPLVYHRLVRLSELKSFRDHKAPARV